MKAERAVIVLEGWDTAGKWRRPQARLGNGSAKLQGLPDCRAVVAERGKHHLQRFWEKLPEPVQIVVFDRSWYGRVLVDRVEGFASKRGWQRGYEEINNSNE
jgi:AMP-polyphosphate phosphotransferase